MLKAFYDVFDRRRRPLRNHHFIVFQKARLAYARIPGSPFQTAFPLLKTLGEYNSADKASPDAPPARPDLWNGNIELLTARELKRRHPDFKVFALVQPPHARIAASYDFLIQGEDPLPAFFEEQRYRKGMSIDAFLDRTADIPDLKADNLIRSQASILCHKDTLVPDLVVDMNRLADDWGKLVSLVDAQCGLGRSELPGSPTVGQTDTLDAVQASPLFQRLLGRYSKDYRLFFPELAKPAGRPEYGPSESAPIDMDMQAGHSKLA